VIRLYSIRNGAAGTRQTLELMAELARQGATLPYAKLAAVRWTVEQWDEMLRSVWQSQEEMDEELTPADFQLRTLVTSGYMIGDCDDAGIVAGALGVAARVPTQFIALRRPADAAFSHVLTVAEPIRAVSVTRWVIDPTAPRNQNYAGWEQMTQAV